MAPTVFPPITFDSSLGKPATRRTGKPKVTGLAPFTAEWKVKNCLHAVAVPSAIPRGKVVSIDTSVAAAMPGVRLVLTPDNVPDFKRIATGGETNFGTSLASNLFPCAETEIYHAGQYLAAVIAETFEAARDAALAVKIKYAADDFQTDVFKADADERPKSLMGEPPVITRGDAEDLLKKSDVTVDLNFVNHGNHHNPLEPHATIAQWFKKDDKDYLRVYDTSQAVSLGQKTLAKMFSLDPTHVEVICKVVGGAFGSKGLMWPNAMLATLCSKAVNAPVKVVVTRAQMYGGTGHRTAISQRVAIGADENGKINSILHSGVASTSVKDVYAEAFTMATRMMYSSVALRLDQKQCRVNTQLPTFMRAPAEAPGMYALEVAMDTMASKLKIDPIEFRIRNEPPRDLYLDKPFSGRHLIECLTSGAKDFGWQNRSREPRANKDGHWLIGHGVAAATYPSLGFPTSVRIVVNADGSLEINCCSHELGTGTATVQCQLLGSLLGIPAGRISMNLGDSTLPPGGISGGSATTNSIGAAILKAVAGLKGALLAMAITSDAKYAKADATKVTFADGKLSGPGIDLPIEQIVKDSGEKFCEATGDFVPSMIPETSNHSFGAQFVEVAVDEAFGLIRVRRMLGCFACGTILNAKTARSQFIGGMIFGVGQALLEKTVWDHRIGRITNDNLAEYHLPVQADIPDIDVSWITDPDFNATPIGAKGIGEIGITGISAAISNAVYNATGRRMLSLPMTPESFFATAPSVIQG